MNTAYLGLLGLVALGATVNLLNNGDFEQGTQNWMLSHGWYEKPAGGGLSAMTVVDGEGREGSRALKFVGNGKRGIAMQVFNVYPGQYRVSGWLKCEGLDSTGASILCEWMSKDNKWLRGDTAGSVTGTTDWKHFETVVEAPAEARNVHLDLLTSEPNNGTVWFDDIAMARVPSNQPPPPTPKLTIGTAAGSEGSLQLTWDPKTVAPGTVRLLVYCSEKPLAQTKPLVPAALLDAETGTGEVLSLTNGHTYHVAGRFTDVDGRASELSAEVTVKVTDRQAPRPGWLEAERTANGVRVGWTPHILDADVKQVSFCLPGEGDKPGAVLKTVEVPKLYAEPRPFFCTQPWLTLDLPVPATVAKVGVRATDQSGNEGEVGWAEIAPPASTAELTGCSVATEPPTTNVPRTMAPPTAVDRGLRLRLMRGQAKGFQVVLIPERDLHQVQVRFAAPVHSDGQTKLDPRWLAYHFLDYVRLEKNSVATPKEELVWPGPSDYPDELDDAPTRDLAAGQAQPLFFRVTAPPEAKPGDYTARATIQATEGRREVTFRFRVDPVALPNPTRLPFVYWMSWDAPCKEFGVTTTSADGWRVLYQIGRLMRAHHERVVVVPWSLVRTWKLPDGTLVHDFSAFDRFIRTFQAAGVDQMFCLSHFGSRTTGEWECKTFSSHAQRVRSAATGEDEPLLDAIKLLPALQDHIEQLGLLKQFVVHVADEPIPVNVESYRELSARVHAAAPKLPRIDAIHVPDLQGSLEHWVPQLNYFEQWLPEYRKAQAAGNKVWFYIAWVPQGKFPNRMIDSSAIKPRVLHWLNALYDTDGYLHWALNHWQIPLTSLGSPGDQYIAWPSKRFVANSSLRYEAEREGLEDCELMFMLRDKLMKQGLSRAQAQAQMETVGRKAVRAPQDYTRSWEDLERVRGELLDKVGGR